MNAARRCASCGGALGPGDRACTHCGTPSPVSPTGGPGGATWVLGQTPPPSEGEAAPPQEPAAPGGDAAASPASGEAEYDGWLAVRRQLEEATRGEFEILGELGRGGMARVYRARDLALDRNVAIKVMAPGLLLGEGTVERFRQEAVTVAKLDHPNIITIHTVREAGPLHYFVMQVVEGASLEALLERPGLMPVYLTQAILYQVGVGLAHAHRQRIIHRDIKPANVLLDPDGNAILTDFGIAKVATTTNLTQTGATIGTPAYMSPEQCRAAELTVASDQYSLGVVAYEMLTGRPPFAGSPFEVMQAHTATPPPSIREQRSECPAEVEAAVLRMLAKNPEDRFPTIAEAIESLGGHLPGPRDPIRADLAGLVKGEGRLPVSTREPLKPTPSSPSEAVPGPDAGGSQVWRRPPVLAAGAVGVAALGIAAALVLRPSAPSDGVADGGSTAAEPVPVSVASITFDGAPDELLVGEEVVVVAGLLDGEGRAVGDKVVEWSSSDPAVASVVGDGAEVRVAGLAAGPVEIRGLSDGVAGSFELSVMEPAPGEVTVQAPVRQLVVGDEVRLSAVLTDARGDPIPDAEMAWSSSDPSVLQVDPARGSVRGLSLGQGRVTATAGDRSGSVAMTVVGRVDDLTLTPPVAGLEAGTTTVLRAAVSSRPTGYVGAEGIGWRSSNPMVATVSYAAGDSVVLTLLDAGESVVTARAGVASDAATLRVVAAQPSVTLGLTPTSVSFEAMEDTEAPSPRSVEVDVGGGAVPGVGEVEYASGAAGWLAPSLAVEAEESWGLALAVDLDGLEAGVYEARVPVQADDLVRTVDVRLTVVENPATAPVVPDAQSAREIEALLDDYLTALDERDVERIRTLFPSVGDDAIDDLLSMRDTETRDFRLVSGSLEQGSAERTLEAEVLVTVYERGGGDPVASALIFTFSRGADGWYIVSFRPVG